MTQIVNHHVIVQGPTLRSPHPFGVGPDYAVVDPEADVEIEKDGHLLITVAPRTTDKGVLIEKVVRFPPGAWTSVTVNRVTKEA